MGKFKDKRVDIDVLAQAVRRKIDKNHTHLLNLPSIDPKTSKIPITLTLYLLVPFSIDLSDSI